MCVIEYVMNWHLILCAFYYSWNNEHIGHEQDEAVTKDVLRNTPLHIILYCKTVRAQEIFFRC